MHCIISLSGSSSIHCNVMDSLKCMAHSSGIFSLSMHRYDTSCGSSTLNPPHLILMWRLATEESIHFTTSLLHKIARFRMRLRQLRTKLHTFIRKIVLVAPLLCIESLIVWVSHSINICPKNKNDKIHEQNLFPSWNYPALMLCVCISSVRVVNVKQVGEQAMPSL